MNKSKIDWKIKHIKSEWYTCGRDAAATILYRDIGGGYVEYKYAICNVKDMFCRKIGVQVANSKTETYKVYQPTKHSNLFVNIILHIGIGNRVSKEFDDLLNKVNFE